MTQYTIGDVEDLTGIKSHVLRYWEEVIPGFAPKKDLGGRRLYSQRDLDLILRLKFLIYEKKFTIEGARNQILHEMTTYDRNAAAMDAIRELRAELTELYMTWRRYSKSR